MVSQLIPNRRGLSLCAVIAALSTLALALPSAGRAVVNIEGHTPAALPDYDSRASAAPTADQLAAASALGAEVSWNRFGVASAVSNNGAFITKGIQAPDAATAARAWLDANKLLFKLDSTASLVPVVTQPLIGTTNDYAIVFRQQADGVEATDAVATVAVVGSKAAGWNVAYASSSLTGGNADATGADALAPAVAWTEAANQAGVNVSVVDVTPESTTDGTTTLGVRGLSQKQHVKKAVFATPHNGSRAAYDATVTTNADGNLDSYQVVVDAQTGDLLYRQSLVDYIADNPTWLAPRHSMPYNDLNAFPWNYPTTDGRSLFCWTPTVGCDVVASDNPATTVDPMGVASKYPWDIQLNVARNRPRHEGNGRQQRRRRAGVEWKPRRLRQPGSRPRDERDARLPARVHGRLVHVGLRPEQRQRRDQPARQRHRSVDRFAVRRAQRDARLGVLPRLRRGPLERPAVQQRRHDDRSVAAAGRAGAAAARQRRSDRKRPVRRRDRQPRQREHGDRRRRPAPDDEPVPLAAAGCVVLRTVRRRRLRLLGLRPRVRPPDREPHDRQGRRRAPGQRRRRDGRGVRRLRRARGLQRAAPAGPVRAQTATPRAHTPPAIRTTASATSWRAGRWAASSRSRARTRTPTRSTTATSGSTTSAPRCTPTARSGSRCRWTSATCSSRATRRPERPRTSPAPAARSPRPAARAIGSGSRTTTTRWC